MREITKVKAQLIKKFEMKDLGASKEIFGMKILRDREKCYVFTIGGCAINWKATLQTTIALSTTEAEYIAITEACKEFICLKGLVEVGSERGKASRRWGWFVEGVGEWSSAGVLVLVLRWVATTDLLGRGSDLMTAWNDGAVTTESLAALEKKDDGGGC
ncbi:hypothetical protein FXO37_17746 [Capsicum annuum]|nr:hypothetical protein FXO37_17746 [Capsicum annuum]